jgi:hypothetical protein
MLEYLDIAIGFATVMLLLSLIVTAVVQGISTILDLRGRNLVWALAKLFDQMLVQAADDAARRDGAKALVRAAGAKALAKAVAGHPAIAPSAKLKAKAIRPEELREILHRLAQGSAVELPPGAEQALKTLVAARVPGGPETLDHAALVAKELERLVPQYGHALQDAIDTLKGQTTLISSEIATWFDTIMDRSSDRFARTSKFWSAGVGAVLALVLHVDSMALIHQISSSAGVRSELVAMAQPSLEHANQMEDFANIAGSTFSDLKQQEAFKAALQKAPAAMTRCADGKAWIEKNAGGNQALADGFEKLCDQKGEAALGALPQQIDTLQRTLGRTQLEVFGRWAWAGFGWQLLGCLMTVAFLTLGGPFWFNVLQQMASLRPSVARKMTGEQPPAAPAAAGTAKA